MKAKISTRFAIGFALLFVATEIYSQEEELYLSRQLNPDDKVYEEIVGEDSSKFREKMVSLLKDGFLISELLQNIPLVAEKYLPYVPDPHQKKHIYDTARGCIKILIDGPQCKIVKGNQQKRSSWADNLMEGRLPKKIFSANEEILLDGHTKTIKDVAAGKEIVATGSDDMTVRIWDLDFGKCQHVLSGHDDCVTLVKLSSCAQFLVSADEKGTLRIWNTMSGECIGILDGHQGSINSVSFNQQETEIITTSKDKTAKVWSISDRACSDRTLSGHKESVTFAEFTGKTGYEILTLSEDGTIRLWNVDSNKQLGIESGNCINIIPFEGRCLEKPTFGGSRIIIHTSLGTYRIKCEDLDEAISYLNRGITDEQMVIFYLLYGKLFRNGLGRLVGKIQTIFSRREETFPGNFSFTKIKLDKCKTLQSAYKEFPQSIKKSLNMHVTEKENLRPLMFAHRDCLIGISAGIGFTAITLSMLIVSKYVEQHLGFIGVATLVLTPFIFCEIYKRR